MKYDTVIGLEVHIQMNTSSKAFCGDGLSFGKEANTHVSAISFAHPGTLPVSNVEHVSKAIKLGLALGCNINQTNYFDRKHYFYPDLPKGYQITQDNEPICIGGTVTINLQGEEKKIRIHHIHMEEDAGKTVHDAHDQYSLVDLNRAGTPLLELVTEPDLSSGEEVFAFIAELQKLLRYIDVSDADMEKGSMRCDCNVSVKLKGDPVLGERCEIKNLNSKRFAREAVKFEAQRQIQMVEAGIRFNKQTLHYDPISNKTSVLREKEGVADYRYFPDPDMPPILISDQQLEKIRESLPELPASLKARLIQEEEMNPDYAEQLTSSPSIFAFYKSLCTHHKNRKASANLMINQILPNLGVDKLNMEIFPLSDEQCGAYLKLIDSGKVSTSIAHKELWPRLLEEPVQNPFDLATKLGLIIDQNDDTLKMLVADVIEAHPAQLEQYKKGKKALLGFFIGTAMRKAGGAIDPNALKKELLNALGKD